MKIKICLYIAKNILVALLGILCLSVGIFCILIENQARTAEENIKTWPKANCEMKELEYRGEYFLSHCTFEINGEKFTVQKQSPVWNAYYNSIRKTADGVEVFFINTLGEKHRYLFQQGQTTEFFLNPQNPAESVLMAGAGSQRSFLYFGILYNLAVIGFALWAFLRHKLQLKSQSD